MSFIATLFCYLDFFLFRDRDFWIGFRYNITQEDADACNWMKNIYTFKALLNIVHIEFTGGPSANANRHFS